MDRLRIESDVARFRAGQFRAQAKNIGVLLDELAALVQQLQVEWQSDKTSDFHAWYYDVLQPELIKGQRAINAIAASIELRAEEEEV